MEMVKGDLPACDCPIKQVKEKNEENEKKKRRGGGGGDVDVDGEEVEGGGTGRCPYAVYTVKLSAIVFSYTFQPSQRSHPSNNLRF